MAELNTGKLTQIIGAVLDVRFSEGKLPEINDAIKVPLKDGEELVVEVAQHLGDDTVRCIAMGPTDGLVRGMEAIATGGPISVPVGEKTLGRMFNVLGNPIDEKPAPEGVEYDPIHRKAPAFEEQSTQTEILETGIKVVDLLCPYQKGGKIGLFGVQELLDCFVEIAPSPRPVQAEEREVQPEEPKFTGFVFKITANIDPNHRSCVAFCKVCSGKFTRNTPYLHVRHNKTMRFSSPTQFMAQRKTTVDEAWAGDIIGLPDNGTFKIGDTLTEGELLHFKGLPSFSPEMFKYIENADPMKTKQLNKGIDQLMDEGVAQLFVNQFNGRKIIGTVGQLQFEVIQYRLENEYNAKCRWEPLSLYKACWIESDDPAELEAFKKRKYQYMAKDRDGRDVFLADSGYVLQMAQMDFKHIKFHFTSEF